MAQILTSFSSIRTHESTIQKSFLQSIRFVLLSILFLSYSILFTNPLLAQSKCLDYGINVGVDYYMFNDFFKAGSPWVPLRYVDGALAPAPIVHHYTVDRNEDFKIVNGAYYNYDHNWNDIADNPKGFTWTDIYDDSYIDYWDMMVDQKKILPNGYPRSIPDTIYQYKGKDVDPNQGLDLTKPIIIGKITRSFNFPEGIPLNGWILKWKGRGKFTVSGIASITNQTLGSTNNLGGGVYEFISSSGKGGNIEFTYASSPSLEITISSYKEPITDIQYIYPGREAALAAGQNINPVFSDKVSQYKTLRYMDYMGANNLKSRATIYYNMRFFSEMIKPLRWDERTVGDWYANNDGNGGTHERIVEISNLTKTNPWVNIPYAAGQDYVDNMMKYYMANLNPDLKLYLEVGNELWNEGGGFSGGHWMDTYANSYYGGDHMLGKGKRISDIFKWAAESAGPGNTDRIVRIVGARDYSPQGFTDDNLWDALTFAWYYGLDRSNSDGNTCKDPVSGKNWRSVLYDYWQANPTDQAGFNKIFQKGAIYEWNCGSYPLLKVYANTAKVHGKRFVAYEGGNHTISRSSDQGNGPTGQFLDGEVPFAEGKTPVYPDYETSSGFVNALAMADQSHASDTIFSSVLDSVQALGADLVNHYGFAGKTNAYGAWNLFAIKDYDESLDYLNSHYSKFKTYNDRIKKSNCNDVIVNVDALSVGAGLSIKLDGLDDYLDVGNKNLPDETSNYTVETWLKPYLSGVKSYVFNLNGSAGNNNSLYISENGKLFWEINGTGSSMKLTETEITLSPEKWYHLAVVKEAQVYKLYINGKQVASISSAVVGGIKNQFTAGAMVAGTSVSFPLKGEIDEFRIWNKARTELEIRDKMCQKVSVTAALKTYLRFDDGKSSVTLNNLADQTKPGILKNVGFSERSGYTVSGAPIGDVSNNVYGASTSLSLPHSDGDKITINFGPGTPDGAHLYWVNQGPYFDQLPKSYEQTAIKKYFGVFMANGTDPSYDLTYSYNGNPALVSGEEDQLRLIKKDDASVLSWIHSGANLDKLNKNLTILCKEKNRGEYTLGFRQNKDVLRPGSGMALNYTTSQPNGVTRVLSGAVPDFKDEYTVSFWGKGAGAAFSLGVKYPENINTSERQEEIGIVDAGGGRIYMTYRKNGPPYGVEDAYPTTQHGDANTWYHYTISRKDLLVTIYINGVVQFQKIFSGPYESNNRIKLLAPLAYPGVQNLTIDEVSLWNIALDQETIRDWMCKKITNKHPFACKNLLLYYNFDQGDGLVIEDKNGSGDLEMNPNSYTYVPSGAAVGDESKHSYTSSSSSPDYISFATEQGDFLEAKRLPSTLPPSVGVQLYRVNNMAPVTNTVSDSAIKSMDSSSYWGMYVCNTSTGKSLYDVTYHYAQNSRIKDETNLRLLDRFDNASPNWENLSSQVKDKTLKTITIPSQQRGEYIAGGDNGTFIFRAPATPEFLVETSKINLSTVCGNSKSLIYKLKKDPLVVSYNWTVPAGLDGFSNADSIVLNVSYSGAIETNVKLSVEAVNTAGKSVLTEYSIKILPMPTVADAGPDQLVNSSSATMNGNSVGSGEIGNWKLLKGSGDIQTVDNPKTQISNLKSGYNIFSWSISQQGQACPSTSDTVKLIINPAPQSIGFEDGSMLPQWVCGGSILTVRAEPVEGVTPDSYQWELPAGFVKVSSSGNKAVLRAVSLEAGGVIKVKAVYGTFVSDAFTSSYISIRVQPNHPSFINTPAFLCLGSSTTISVANDPNSSSYEWTIPYGLVPEYPKSTTKDIHIASPYAYLGFDSIRGYIKVQAFNDGCTSPQAADSFYVQIKNAPQKPYVMLTSDGGSGDQACEIEKALYSVVDPNPNYQYNWRISSSLDFIEYFGPNHHSALITPPYNGANVYVSAKFGEGECSVSDEFNVNIWAVPAPEHGYTPDAITDELGQTPSVLEVGKTYTLRSTCSTCPAGQNDQYRWRKNYYWDVPEGISIIKDAKIFDAYDSTITIKVDKTVAGAIRVWAITLQGCVGKSDTLKVHTPDGIFAPKYVSGSVEFCAGTTDNLNITVDDVQADKYIWTLPDGTMDTTSSNILKKTITKGMVGNLLVKAVRGPVVSEITKIFIRIKSSVLPKPVFYDGDDQPIQSALIICKGGDMTQIKISDVGGKRYVWTRGTRVISFSPNWLDVDVNGNGTIEDNEKQLQYTRVTGTDTTLKYYQDGWGVVGPEPTNGYITVTSENGCAGPDRKDSVFYTYAEPASRYQPVFVEAPTTLCAGSSVTYRIKEIPSITEYYWILPQGLSSTELTTKVPWISVDVGKGSGGKISVKGYSSACGGGYTAIGYTEAITISGEPVDFHFIDAPLSGCLGETLNFKVNDIGVSSYLWSLPGGLSNTILDNSDSDAEVITHGSNPWGYKYDWDLKQTSSMYKGNYIENANYVNKGGEDSLVYHLTVPKTAKYKVYFSYLQSVYNSDHATLDIYHKNGKTRIVINEKQDPEDGIWQSLGEYEFLEGKGSKIVVLTDFLNDPVTADAIKLVSLGVEGGTDMSFTIKDKEGGPVCVTVPYSGCPSGYTICTKNINMSGEMSEPSFTFEINAVCPGQTYTYTASDIGADSYNWILPSGWKIGAQTGTVKGQGRTVEITAGNTSASTAVIAVYGTLKCGNQISDTVYTNNIKYNTNCTAQLERPAFTAQPINICEGEIVVYTVSPILNAEAYVWILPVGITQSGSNKADTVITQENSISVIGTGTGRKGFIKVKVQASGIPDSQIASTASEVTVNNSVTDITVSGSNTICVGGSVTLTSASSTGNQWFRNGQILTGQNLQTYTANAEGNYNLIVTNGTCISDSTGKGKAITITATVKSNIVVAGSNIICQGNGLKLSSSSSTGNKWYKDGVEMIDITQDIEVKAAGTYNVIFTNGTCTSDSTGSSVQVKVTAKPVSLISASGNTFCETMSISSAAISGNQWYRNGKIIADANGQTYLVSESGYYNVLVTDGSCSSDTSGTGKTLTNVGANKKLTLSAADICKDESGSLIIKNAEANTNYNVFVNDNSVGISQGTGADLRVDISSTNLSQSSNSIKVEAEKGVCPVVSLDEIDTIKVREIKTDLTVNGSEACYKSNGILAIIGSQKGVTYEAFINNISATSAQGTGTDLSLIIAQNKLSQNGNIVTVKASGFGCTPKTLVDTANIIVRAEIAKPGPVSGPTEICQNDVAVFTIIPEVGKNYVWGRPSVAVVKDSTQSMVELQFNDSISGTGYVTVRTQEGSCLSDTSRLAIRTNPNCNKIFIPNIITPNSNDNNGAWTIEGLQNYPNAEIKIMNRWGALVYESKGYNKKWDGSSKNNELLPTGTYYYIIDLQNKGLLGKRNVTYNGSVTIMR